ncbi:hypothetical protein ABVV53_08965 [Novosphingobium sp. RD2P27]|uniref:Bacterial surface antigen (D15) domain-containing protein n=1 Tax=Novosphingobium kalidii TaxID=3230299 RepID=A0ABV2D152_9SPHN
MIAGRRRRARGQPLVVLTALLLGWAGARITSLGSEGGLSLPEVVLTVGTATAAAAESSDAPLRTGPQSYAGTGYGVLPMGFYGAPVQYSPARSGMRGGPIVAAGGEGPHFLAPGTFAPAPSPAEPALRFFDDLPRDHMTPPGRREDGIFAAALPSLNAQPTSARYGEVAALLGGRIGKLIGNGRRWSADAWALIRDDGAAVLPTGALPATYGASQAGAVLRYRLDMQDSHAPTAYLRTTSTLGAVSETSAALGLSVRPLPAVPIVGAIEGRLTDQAGSRRVQPAAMAVTELPALSLPGALRAEVYGQAGYIGGRYATPFADGQVRLDRGLLSIGRYEARVGAGVWGGVQKGASRLDAGPTAIVSMPLAPRVFGRIGLDWRFRVTGNAEPGSGPALTVGAGF